MKQRETKFRVWDKKNKKWIDDIDIAINQKGLLFIRYEHQTDFKPMSLTKSSNFEIVWFTGLHDKQGKEIYEGDRVVETDEHGNEDSGIVGFRNGAFVIDWGDVGFKYFDNDSSLEILGNIYENPELINY